MDWESFTSETSFQHNESSLNRSFSAPNIIECGNIETFNNQTDDQSFLRRVCYVEQIVHRSSQPVLLRHYSYEQIYRPTPVAKNEALLKRNVQSEGLSKDIIELSDKFNTTKVKCEVSESPMEVDYVEDVSSEEIPRRRLLFKNSRVSNDDIKVVDGPDGDPIESHLYPCEMNNGIGWFTKSVLILIVLIAVFAALFILLLYQSNIVHINDVHNELKKSVYNQDEQIDVAVRTLNNRNVWYNNFKILGFVGPTGVGKTLMANIIKKHFSKKFIHDMDGSLIHNEKEQDKIINELYKDYFAINLVNLIVIDDIGLEDIDGLSEFVAKIPENTFVLIITIFKIQKMGNDLTYKIHYEEISEINKKIHGLGPNNELIVFNEFSKEHLKEWMFEEFERQKSILEINDPVFLNKVVEGVLKKHDVKFLGMKGVIPLIRNEFENVLDDSYKM